MSLISSPRRRGLSLARRGRRRLPTAGPLGASLVTVLAATALLASSAVAAPLGCVPVRRGVFDCPKVTYDFQTLNDKADLTFNQLLGINDGGKIAGYFGNGLPMHPNQGYVLHTPYSAGVYHDTNFPGSVQTQVTGLNNKDIRVGFYSTMNNPSVDGANPVNDNFGWVKQGNNFFKADFPTQSPMTPPMDQLLGVNDSNVAVGFFTDATGANHGYTFDIGTKTAKEVTVSGLSNITASAIANNGDIAGFGTNGAGNTQGFLIQNNFPLTINFPNATATQPLGVNSHDEVVGVATVGGQLQGFTYYPGYGFNKIDAPNGVGTTTVNGVNNCGDLVGFYTTANGDVTNGLLGKAQYTKNVFPSSTVFPIKAAVAQTAAHMKHEKKPHKKKKKLHTKLPKGC